MSNNYSTMIKYVGDTAYVLHTGGKFQLEAIMYAVESIHESKPGVTKFYFDFTIMETMHRGFGKHCRFQYAEIVGGMIEVYELSYLHNKRLKDIFNPMFNHVVVNSAYFSRYDADAILQKINAEDKGMNFTTLDESIPYAKIRLMEF